MRVTRPAQNHSSTYPRKVTLPAVVIKPMHYCRAVGLCTKTQKLQDNCSNKDNYIHSSFLAIETSGALGPKSLYLATELGRRLGHVTGQVRPNNFLIQRLTVAVQHGNSASVLGTTERAGNNGACWEQGVCWEQRSVLGTTERAGNNGACWEQGVCWEQRSVLGTTEHAGNNGACWEQRSMLGTRSVLEQRSMLGTTERAENNGVCWKQQSVLGTTERAAPTHTSLRLIPFKIVFNFFFLLFINNVT